MVSSLNEHNNNKKDYTVEDLYNEEPFDDPQFNDPEYYEESVPKVHLKDIGEGFNILKKHGKIGKYFLVAIIAIFALILLNAFDIIPMWLYTVLLVVFAGIVFYVFYKSHENDEETLD